MTAVTYMFGGGSGFGPDWGSLGPVQVQNTAKSTGGQRRFCGSPKWLWLSLTLVGTNFLGNFLGESRRGGSQGRRPALHPDAAGFFE